MSIIQIKEMKNSKTLILNKLISKIRMIIQAVLMMELEIMPIQRVKTKYGK
jgi:hypothetical protein